MSPPEQRHIIILGAGVTALSTSLALRVSPYTSHLTQTIIATHLPGDNSIDFTSPSAGGHWRSFASLSESEAEIRKWDKKTYEAWMAVLESGYANSNEVEKETGLGVRESRNYWAKDNSETKCHDGRGLWWSTPRHLSTSVEGPKSFTGGVRGFEVLDLSKERTTTQDENVPVGAIFGVKYQSVCINIPTHLSFLLRRVREGGTTIIKATADTSHNLDGIVQSVKMILLSHDPSIEEESIFALINCTGLSARHFVSPDEAAKIYPIRGQTILVKGEASAARTYVGFSEEDELVYVIPRPGSGTTILGGCKQVGSWSAEVDEWLNEKIMDRIKAWRLAEELIGERGDFELLRRQVGLRPGRSGGPRVEVEMEGDENGKVKGLWVVHSYGHAGGGYQCSVGCGERVAEIVASLLGLRGSSRINLLD